MTLWPWAYASLLVAFFALRAHFQLQVRRAHTRFASVHRSARDLGILVFGAAGGLGTMAYLASPEAPAWAALAAPDAVRALGVAVGVAGLALFAWSHRALGRNWSLTIGIKEGHEMVTAGPYRGVRHPMYTAILAWAIGVALVSAHLLGGLPWVLMAGFAASRAPIEERAMAEAFGEAYRTYMARTGRFLPRFPGPAPRAGA